MTNTADETARVTRFCVLMLALEWIFFGSAHFAYPALAQAEVPEMFGGFRGPITVISGMIEVSTGVLILLPRMRKRAALVSICLLLAFVPAIYRMLAVDAAMVPFTGAGLSFLRLLLVPNHVLLLLCASQLYASSGSAEDHKELPLEGLFGPARPVTERKGTIVVASVMLLANIAGFLVIVMSGFNRSTSGLWAMMCLAVGAAAGFLFGVPRVNTAALKTESATSPGRRLRPNSNIELISDWITKIIVGVGLVEVRKIGAFIDDISSQLGQSLVAGTSAVAFAKALIVYFTCAGLIQGYLLTRLYLSREFEDDGVSGSPAK